MPALRRMTARLPLCPALYLAVALGLAAAPALAQQDAAPQVSGVVMAACTDRPVAGAAITVEQTGATATTDDTGAFSVAVPPAGQATLAVSAEGYKPRTVDVDAATAALYVGLEPAP